MQATNAEYWRQLWLEREALRRKPDDSTYWDGRAAEFARHSHISPYAEDFLKRLGNPTQKSILDFGAGVGELALPLAKTGNSVIACDFSAGMLEGLTRKAKDDGVLCVASRATGDSTVSGSVAKGSVAKGTVPNEIPLGGKITTKLLAWADDWAAAGIASNSVDIAFASRSTMVADLAACFTKLESVARERVAITISTEFTPRGFKRLGSDADGSAAMGGFLPDHILAMNILFFKGAYPELHYIDSYKPLKVEGDSPRESARAKTNKDEDDKSLGVYESDDGSAEKYRLVRWAFISWKPVG